jgi:hypothetical protein
MAKTYVHMKGKLERASLFVPETKGKSLEEFSGDFAAPEVKRPAA